jgi:hypothetical protein
MGMQSGLKNFRRFQPAIQRALIKPGGRLGQSYLFDQAAPRVKAGEANLVDIILAANSAQDVVGSARPYKPGRLARYALTSKWDLDDTLIDFFGAADRHHELQSALAGHVYNHPRFRNSNNDRYFFNPGRPHNAIIVQVDILQRLGIYGELDVSRHDRLRDTQLGLLCLLGDKAAGTPLDRADYNEGVVERWDVEAAWEFLEDRRRYLKGDRRVADIVTRKWRFLSDDGTTLDEYRHYLKGKEKMVPDHNQSYHAYFGEPARVLEGALRESIEANDVDRALNVWSVITQRRREPGMDRPIIGYHLELMSMAEAQCTEYAELLKVGRVEAIPDSIYALIADNYLMHRPKFAAQYNDYPMLLTNDNLPVAADWANLAVAFSAWLKPRGAYFSNALDLAVAHHVYKKDLGHCVNNNPDSPSAKARLAAQYSRLKAVSDTVDKLPFSLPQNMNVDLQQMRDAPSSISSLSALRKATYRRR